MRDQAMVTSVKLEQDLKDRVQQLAVDQRRSAHWAMRWRSVSTLIARRPARAFTRRRWPPGQSIRPRGGI
ncbi:ribbon-helix-helix protein, CopG family [Lichenicoccus sp.]|uniref:ribbon-helix-helix protein, CopG family n=1 Tax=Lichenicoccus sp. TaxID=2781899 RepID=UPI003D0EEA34